MSLNRYMRFDDKMIARFEEIDAGYKQMYLDPENSKPMFLIESPVSVPTWEERLADPLVMMKAELDKLRAHFEIGDDQTPTIRVEFGTGQVAAAFGCEMFFPADNLPCAGSHILKNAADVYKMEIPSLDAGWFGKLKEWTGIFLENMPEDVKLQHPDIQSAFNTAHLVRGNDIFTDFYDDPEALDALLDKVTDYLIRLVPWLKSMISGDKEWFYDWGALWKGAARISNCSMHLISAQLYLDHVLERDMRLMKAIGGGRIHYCGTQGRVIDEFFKNPDISG
ncbi:MAG: hypothetical protein EG826_19065, partial [Deltaproteobacteria bacterium]|nr:hypothetical protein [Deltaproteobacteria bacterium]